MKPTIYDSFLKIACMEDSLQASETRARITGRVITFRDEYEYQRAGTWWTKFCYGMVWPCGCMLIYRWVGQPVTRNISEIMDSGYRGCKYHVNLKDKKFSKWINKVVEFFVDIQPDSFDE